MITTADTHEVIGWVRMHYEWFPNIVLADGVAYCQCPLDLAVIRVTRNEEGDLTRCCEFCNEPGIEDRNVSGSWVYRCETHKWNVTDEHRVSIHTFDGREHPDCPHCQLHVGDLAYAEVHWRVWRAVEVLGLVEENRMLDPRGVAPGSRWVQDLWTHALYVVAPSAILVDEPVDMAAREGAVFGY